MSKCSDRSAFCCFTFEHITRRQVFLCFALIWVDVLSSFCRLQVARIEKREAEALKLFPSVKAMHDQIELMHSHESETVTNLNLEVEELKDMLMEALKASEEEDIDFENYDSDSEENDIIGAQLQKTRLKSSATNTNTHAVKSAVGLMDVGHGSREGGEGNLSGRSKEGTAKPCIP